MKLLTTSIAIAMLIPMALILMTIMTSMRMPKNREKSSPYECGFDPNHTARTPFSLRFFLLAVIFLIFDVEIALLMPLPLITVNPNKFLTLIPAFIFLLILLLGILHEWNEKSLDWTP
uniref:NADH dehydrogenase subunit 3 n=1 Tax=Paralvinella palmiformis TaxID=53620 RepID=UPI00208E6163|nr:NADH dehydrogenase subunit 3 [Paralvinella palmiformis]UJI65672.1 NADH dehydrogenase subunit 3 [Paralvinella palmiformis]